MVNSREGEGICALVACPVFFIHNKNMEPSLINSDYMYLQRLDKKEFIQEKVLAYIKGQTTLFINMHLLWTYKASILKMTFN